MLQQSVPSLYRQYLRQVKRLPHNHLRQFFQLKASDDFRALVTTPAHKIQIRDSKIRRIHKDLRRINLALTGRQDAFRYILDTAYGRRGKLRWELMEPLLTQAHPSSPPIKPLIRSVPNSRPPIYSPELTALLVNTASRTNKPLDAHQLKFPPTLSPRADPTSEEARLLGPLSKRLELNTRWRYFTREWKKVYPPLEIAVKSKAGSLSMSLSDVVDAGGRILQSQDQGLLSEVEDIVGPPTAGTPLTRRERLTGIEQSQGDLSKHRHPSRWLRRRYQELLGRLPVLILNQGHKRITYNVNLPHNSIAQIGRNTAHRRPALDVANLAWLERVDVLDKQKQKTQVKLSTLYNIEDAHRFAGNQVTPSTDHLGSNALPAKMKTIHCCNVKLINIQSKC
ncbi:hypothetical protein F5878DRAFT_526905 [Lentinula raphanica]|uniref:LYR motif-containing protein Cup1-like N-terminal domain-containing protein n=1 Tax=Lentinula raphanica TaxID=153919 RepID=A0AA38UM95_9AGAR|nr:hypothetical protein F5878DRAFT_526905 [Lentinula raphanica]